jgi:hypothetical protein
MKLRSKPSKQQNIMAAICAVILGISAGSQANAQSFGIKFLGQTTDPVTGSAGVVPISGWNNIANATYNSGTVLSSDGSSSATLTLAGPGAHNTWRSSGGVLTGGNDSLMNGYMDLGGGVNGTATASISGLVSGSVYDVFIYDFSDQTRPSNNGDWLSNYSVNGGAVSYVPTLGVGTSAYDATSATVGGAFSGFVQGTTYSTNFNTGTANASDFGNYIEFLNVTATGGVITIAGNPDTANTFRSPLNGFEIVAVPEPSIAGLSVLGGLLALVAVRRCSK